MIYFIMYICPWTTIIALNLILLSHLGLIAKENQTVITFGLG